MTSDIKSRPRYTDRMTLDQSGRVHVVVAAGVAAGAAVSSILARARAIDAPIRILAVDAEIASLPVSHYESEAALLRGLRDLLELSRMGLRLYAVGPEAFLWAVDRIAADYGFGKGEVAKFLAGSLARKVYCSHCKTMSDGIVANLHRCPGCGTMLLVRDHFSRRLGAFMGVKVDAEEPGRHPEIFELYR